MSTPLAIILEDDPKQANIFTKTFDVAGFTTETYHRGDKGLARLKEVTPQVLLTDMHMPFISGLEILQLTQNEERFANTFIIIATADIYLTTEEIKAKADHLLTKPVRFGKLRELAGELFTKYSK